MEELQTWIDSLLPSFQPIYMEARNILLAGGMDADTILEIFEGDIVKRFTPLTED